MTVRMLQHGFLAGAGFVATLAHEATESSAAGRGDDLHWL
jgi:hypothetical protein